jgi:hypothetical protein
MYSEQAEPDHLAVRNQSCDARPSDVNGGGFGLHPFRGLVHFPWSQFTIMPLGEPPASRVSGINI